jgi:hypothetical protein
MSTVLIVLRALALVLLVGFSGCILIDDPPASSACLQGDGLFVKAQHHPGFTGPDYQYMFYTLGRDGRLVYFRANEADATGSGKLQVKPGAMHNITVAEVRQEMERVGIAIGTRDFNVSLAFKDTAPPALFDSFCGVVLDEFYAYKPRYDNDNIADCDGFEFTITTERGTHRSYSYCETGPQGVREAFDRIRDRAWERFNIEGL